MITSVTKFFLLCSGADRKFLSRCSTENAKYAGLGATIFFTGCFAALAAGYALYTIFDTVLAAVVLGLAWGFMIFNLDRYIISGMRKRNSKGQEILQALPRLAIAILISIVIVKPLELKIFEKEIMPEVIVMQQQAKLRQEEQVKSRFASDQQRLQHEITQLTTALQTKTAQRDAAVKAAQEEADGTGGSRKRNAGPIYKLKKADAEKLDTELTALKEITQQKILTLERKRDTLDSTLSAALGALPITKRDGLAARMEALNTLSATSAPIRTASWFIILLFIVIEITPVLVKLISLKGPYDNLLNEEEHRFMINELAHTGELNQTLRHTTKHWTEDDKTVVDSRISAAWKQ